MSPQLSIVIPALDEQDNIDPLIEQVKQAVIDQGIDAELIVVDDGSTDETLARLNAAAAEFPWVRPLHRAQPQGQSAAMFAGIAAARGTYVAMLDADLQNDPADLPHMLKVITEQEVDLVQGDRSANRRDTFVRRCSSWVGRTARRLILSDVVRDTGCSSRMMKTELAQQLPLQFKGMHRFIPVYSKMLGAKLVEVPVNHRQRHAGVAKYGVMNRALVGLVDCFAMRWMLKRYRNPAAVGTDQTGEARS